MNLCFLISIAACITFLSVTNLRAAPDPNVHLYLLFGQSNMAGGGNTSDLMPEDCDTTSRVKVLAFCDCSTTEHGICKQYSVSRIGDQWYTAYPPLHSCSEGVSPGDYFVKTVLDSIREDITIGLIPCALSGQSITVFKKGGSGYAIPTWAHPTLGNSSPYNWMIQRCKHAQETGVIKGILFHQGESDNGQPSWVGTTKAVFDSIKKDLGLDSNLVFVVGELLQKSTSHNKLVNQLASEYPNCIVASSKDLNAKDQYHFNTAGMRELGRRFARAFLSLSDKLYVPRKETVAVNVPVVQTVASSTRIRSRTGEVTIYSLDGKK